MALQRLESTGDNVAIQATTFTADALGRFICSTWQEATANGGPPVNVIVVGGGMYGAYCAAQLYRQRPTSRVVVLEAGPYLVPEHVQNLGMIGLNVPSPLRPDADSGVAREVVWGLPWRGNVDFPGLAYCVGGSRCTGAAGAPG